MQTLPAIVKAAGHFDLSADCAMGVLICHFLWAFITCPLLVPLLAECIVSDPQTPRSCTTSPNHFQSFAYRITHTLNCQDFGVRYVSRNPLVMVRSPKDSGGSLELAEATVSTGQSCDPSWRYSTPPLPSIELANGGHVEWSRLL
jgi:hypothetical protein